MLQQVAIARLEIHRSRPFCVTVKSRAWINFAEQLLTNFRAQSVLVPHDRFSELNRIFARVDADHFSRHGDGVTDFRDGIRFEDRE